MMKIGDDVIRTKITHRPEPDHAARQLGALSGNDRAITVVHVAHYRRAVEPVRETKDGHGGRQWTRGLEHRQAERLAPGLQRGRQAQMPGQHFRQALLLDHGEGFPQRHHQGYRWGERGFTFVERSLRPAEIEIEARHPSGRRDDPHGLVARRNEGEAGRAHQRLLRGRHQNVDSP